MKVKNNILFIIIYSALKSAILFADSTTDAPLPPLVLGPQPPAFADSNRTAQVAAHTQASVDYLNALGAGRNAIVNRNNALLPQNSPVLTQFNDSYYRVIQGSLVEVGKDGSQIRVIVDATKLPAGSAVTAFVTSPDQSKLAYGYSIGGSDWNTWSVRDLSVLNDLGDKSFFVKATGGSVPQWSADSKGLFYSSLTASSLPPLGMPEHGVSYHDLGVSSATDQLIFKDSELPHTIKYNVAVVDANTVVAYRSLTPSLVPLSAYSISRDKEGRWTDVKPLLPPNRHRGIFVGIDGEQALFQTSMLGNNYGILAVDVHEPSRTRVVLPAHDQLLISQAQLVGDKMLVQYVDRKIKTVLKSFDLNGRLVSEWKPAQAGLFDWGALTPPTGGRNSLFGDMTYSTLSGLDTLRFDAVSGKVLHIPGKPVDFDSSQLETQSVNFQSVDGKKIPMLLAMRKDLGGKPLFAYEYAYGAIGINNLPIFNQKIQMALEAGGVVAFPASRGGGEAGVSWQEAGTFDRNLTLADHAYASRWLKKTFPSVSDRVVFVGRSFGGSFALDLYGMYSDDFAAFSVTVPVADLVKEIVNNPNDTLHYDDVGYPRGLDGKLIYTEKAFENLKKINPIDVIIQAQKPKPLIIFVSANDNRADPGPAFDAVLRLESKFGDAASGQIHFVLYDGVGHDGHAEATDEIAFLARTFGSEHFNLKSLTHTSK